MCSPKLPQQRHRPVLLLHGNNVFRVPALRDLHVRRPGKPPAGKKGVVLMYGPGFNAPEGTVRISLANLNAADYSEIARRLFELLDDYYAEYESVNMLDEAA